MKILFVLDQLPYPPRNGVTIPTFNYMRKIAPKKNIFLLFLNNNSQKISKKQLSDNSANVNKLWAMDRVKKSKFVRIRDEILLDSIYFLGWRYNLNQIKRYLSGYDFDVVWVSSFLACDIIDSLFELLGSRPVYVAGINDCTTAVFRSELRLLSIKSLDLKNRISYMLHWLRSWTISRIEARILNKYDFILVQTGVEKTWLNNISKNELNEKIIILSNGVNDVLFSIPIYPDNKDILFLGRLTGIYSDVAIWLIEKVWPIIRTAQTETRFYIIGYGASRKLVQKIKQDSRIAYNEYLPNIKDIFKGKAVTLAPVFKGYGTINKIIESMAAGVPVVSDDGGFNGINNFKDNRHGIVAIGPKSMANAVKCLMDSTEKYLDIAHSARDLIKRQFSWEDRIKVIEKKLRFHVKQKKYMRTKKMQ